MGSISAFSLCSLPKISLRSNSHKQRLEAFQASGGAGSSFLANSLSLRRNRGLLRFRSLTVKASASSRGDGGGARQLVSGRRVGSFSCLEIGEIGRIVEPRRRGRRMEEALLGNLLKSFSFKRLLEVDREYAIIFYTPKT